MYKTVIVCITLLMSASICGTEPSPPSDSSEYTSCPEATISAKLYTPEEVLDTPILRNIRPFEPEHNRIVIELQNWPVNQEIVMEVKRLASADPEAFQPLMTFSIQNDSTFLTSDQRLLPLLAFSSKDYLLGERVVCRFRTADGAVSKEISGCPNPAIFQDKNGTTALRAELVSISPTVYTIEMPTMKEGEEYDIKTVILASTTTCTTKYASKTPFHFYPSAKGNAKGGKSRFEVRRGSGDVYFLKLPWGSAVTSSGKAQKTYRALD